MSNSGTAELATRRNFGSSFTTPARRNALDTGFSEVSDSVTVFGSGWSILVWDTIAKKLLIVQLYDQQGNVPIGLVPLLTLDMWEHAFYLQYKNVKADYVKAWCNVVNWANVMERFANAVSMSHVNL